MWEFHNEILCIVNESRHYFTPRMMCVLSHCHWEVEYLQPCSALVRPFLSLPLSCHVTESDSHPLMSPPDWLLRCQWHSICDQPLTPPDHLLLGQDSERGWEEERSGYVGKGSKECTLYDCNLYVAYSRNRQVIGGVTSGCGHNMMTWQQHPTVKRHCLVLCWFFM